ncbi:hypothetical protein B0T16DRAFT_110508 [Cercophora newfieldiana]|uniref:Uncharacterized protein n=1 Tax=Cercophora newfieldiana TaxID=92897 RepID=A0AA39YK59_9PEZI|nr:hypothetical protein B0T16DRAFT_110508 [Cercophora newfieldiana]
MQKITPAIQVQQAALLTGMSYLFSPTAQGHPLPPTPPGYQRFTHEDQSKLLGGPGRASYYRAVASVFAHSASLLNPRSPTAKAIRAASESREDRVGRACPDTGAVPFPAPVAEGGGFVPAICCFCRCATGQAAKWHPRLRVLGALSCRSWLPAGLAAGSTRGRGIRASS